MSLAPTWECQRSVDVGVPARFAWAYMTDIRNWNDPPAEFALDGPFVEGTRGTTRMPGRPPCRSCFSFIWAAPRRNRTSSWFGTVKGLHLDTYLELRFIDGFRVELRRERSDRPEKLYFANFGGYDPASVAELHQFGVFAACSPAEAKQKGKASLLTRSLVQHKDNVFDVDDCFAVGEVGDYVVHLVPDSRVQPFVPDWFGYRVIG